MPEKIANYAITEENSRGRYFQEKPHPYRTAFERDRDRIIHCQAFRRLEGKTQVFTPGLDDNYRNRLTHTLEVAQIARTIAKALGLNTNLTEAISLAHDLGHPPFGHMGEEILNNLMAEYGGFEHNRQTLRIVDLLEHPYPDFRGLNLMYETRLGLAKHRSPYDRPGRQSFQQSNCSLEGQVADIADRIAYNCHDLEDGMRSGLLKTEQLNNIHLLRRVQQMIKADIIKDPSIVRTRTAKAIIDELVSDCIDTSKKIIADSNIKTTDDVYNHTSSLVALSDDSQTELLELEKALSKNLYEHKSIMQTRAKVRLWLKQLFERFCRNPKLMPAHFQELYAQQSLQRTVCDYIAGMTDRYCLKSLEADHCR